MALRHSYAAALAVALLVSAVIAGEERGSGSPWGFGSRILVAKANGQEQSSPPPPSASQGKHLPPPPPPPSPVPSVPSDTRPPPSGQSNQSPPPPPAAPDGSARQPPPPSTGGASIPPPSPSSGRPLNPSLPPPPSPSSLATPPSAGPENKTPPSAGPNSGGDGKQGEGAPPENSKEECSTAATRCWDHLVVCFQRPKNDAKKLFFLVKNEEGNDLNVTLIVPPSMKLDVKTLNLTKNGTRKIEIAMVQAGKTEIVLTAMNKNCSVLVPASGGDSFWPFPAYGSGTTSLYVAYALFLTALLSGGIWVCCKYGKSGRRVNDGVPYQQLEMGIHAQSNPADDTDTANGWDQGWIDDWDEEEATPSPAQINHSKSFSANGFTSKSLNGNGLVGHDD